MVSSPLQCWWLYWSLPCWQERCGLRTRGARHVFGGFLLLAALITDKPAHRQQSRMEMCWSQTWRFIQENSTQWLPFFFFVVSVVLLFSVCLTISPSGMNATWHCKAVTLTPQDSGEMMTANISVFNLRICLKDPSFSLQFSFFIK